MITKKYSTLFTNRFFAFLFCLCFNNVVRLPALAIALFGCMLCKVEKSVALGSFASPAKNDIRTEPKKLSVN